MALFNSTLHRVMGSTGRNGTGKENFKYKIRFAFGFWRILLLFLLQLQLIMQEMEVQWDFAIRTSWGWQKACCLLCLCIAAASCVNDRFWLPCCWHRCTLRSWSQQIPTVALTTASLFVWLEGLGKEATSQVLWVTSSTHRRNIVP